MEIPSKFSPQTMEHIARVNAGESTGLPPTCRNEIVSALHSHMIQFEPKPSPHEYKTICQRFIQLFPQLKDKSGINREGIVS